MFIGLFVRINFVSFFALYTAKKEAKIIEIASKPIWQKLWWHTCSDLICFTCFLNKTYLFRLILFCFCLCLIEDKGRRKAKIIQAASKPIIFFFFCNSLKKKFVVNVINNSSICVCGVTWNVCEKYESQLCS